MPSPSRSTHWVAWSTWYATSLTALPATTGQRLVGRPAQLVVQQVLVRREVQQPSHRVSEVAVRQLAQLQVEEVALVPEVGEIVLGPARALDLTGVLQQRPGLAELVEPDVAQGNVLLELRGGRDPLGGALRGDQRVVAEPEGVGEEVVHRCSTPSGTW